MTTRFRAQFVTRLGLVAALLGPASAMTAASRAPATQTQAAQTPTTQASATAAAANQAPAAQADAVPEVPRLSMADFKKLQKTNAALVIDVRDPGSYRAGHIPGALNVPFDDIAARVEEVRIKAHDRPIVTYCSCPSEHSSAVAAGILRDHDVKHASALIGGFPEWVTSGGKIER